MDDSALVSRAAAGDEEAFELLVRRHADAAWTHARTLLGDDFAAEEAVQDAFVKAHRALGGFRGESAFRTWLLAICHRGCLDRLRAPRLQLVPLDRAPEADHADDPDARLALAAALCDLSVDERDGFLLVDVLGYSREEAAGIAGVPSSTMRSRVARARERLATALADMRGVGAEQPTTNGR